MSEPSEPSEARWQRLGVLLEPFHEQAVATARRLSHSTAEGDDLYQDTLLRAFEKLHTLRDESRFRSWFFATLLNRHRNRHRGSFWRRFLSLEEAFQNGREPVGGRGETRSSRCTPAGRITAALALLRPEQREALVLFEIDGFAIEEISVMQKASIPAVKSRLVRGREALRARYARVLSESTDIGDSLQLLDPFPGLPAAARSAKEVPDD
jgi:RNA polymerase sigma-70 factor (ECF subfamily)